ncbi:pH-response regulator protein palF/RIM8 [Diplodia seriata]|uniref:pH-response regulator protein palF/RIM8 n=1 Tax=Diplodia seriata TaxID=420778 RepID=A0A1S8B9F6_9PEZI|nr:pH-response regulator protein palF/RIM8 [Diplodia seriata]
MLVPFTPIEEQNYGQLVQQLCEDCGLSPDGKPVEENFDLDDPRIVERLRSWLTRLRQTCLHPQVGGRNRRALGRGNAPLRTVDEVLNVMIEQNDTLVRAEEREHVLAQVLRGHIFGFVKNDTERSRNALGIYNAALEQAEMFVTDARRELAKEVAKLNTDSMNFAGETEIDLKEESESDSEEDDKNGKKSGRMAILRKALRSALEVQHICTFYVASAYYQIKTNEDLTQPESDAFRELERLETQYYDRAKVIRKELLRECHSRAERTMRKIKAQAKFERGTISYMLTSTMTRPTTIMPTATCDRKIYLIESIDIAPLIRPKPRIVTLERVSRRSRAKSKVKKGTNTGSGSNGERSNGEGSSGDQSNGQAATEASRSSRVSELSEVDTPGSPAPSDTSFESHFSSSQGGSSNASGALSARGTENGKQGSTKAVFVDKKPITATIELLKAGFLRGDNIPLKICVSHTKHVQNLRGIIVTLYRQARVDMHPAIPVVMNAKGEKVSSEDYYPKSKTGLGGLSLSSAGSSHVFRKDLAQSFAPLIVDPRTRTAEVKASVCVPDDAFPSITSVPGAMISFKYYVEIVVDLQGKLTGLDKYFSNSGMMLASAPQLGKTEDTNSGVFSAWGGHFLDTEQLRRDKGVVSCVFEVIVGTRDSDRRKGKRRATSENELDHSFSVSGDSNGLTEEQSQLTGYASQQTGFPLQSERHNYYYGQPLYDDGYGEEVPHPYAHPTYPVSDLTNEDALPEKERLRRAEARLMPSQPPVEGGSSAADAIHAPSAPVIPEERRDVLYPTASSADGAGPSAPPLDALGPPSPSVSEETAAPTYEERQGESSHVARSAATDDKHDLARRRLEMDRSAPGEMANEDAAGGGRSAPSAPLVDTLTPSAPVLTDEEYVFPSTHATDLPRYER